MYVKIRKSQLDDDVEEAYRSHFIKGSQKKNPHKERWDRVAGLFGSSNPSDWRLAIIEADSMLEDLTLRLGYSGATLGERLKQVEPSDFPHLQSAWKAHLVRNKIAHEGLTYDLSTKEANQVRKWYEEVFREARYI